MADFNTAWERTARFEGGYVNDPSDSGGETYNGISRRYNPNWRGWKVVDEQKKKQNFPNNLKDRKGELLILEKDLYKKVYWDGVWGDKNANQKVANDLYDTAVNMGVGTSIKLTQKQFKKPESGAMSPDLLKELNKVV